ncbi:hypothetical protein TM48_02956 [Mycobacterium shottsii]|uniref:Secreted protein n=1 Tax=Mycobacterium shottsii TaxID=133549 RepID=A0A7I7LF10_9MYCO|nr:hypothetical protein TM48_02956 [Mycobacterium shottsii]BBX58626.1 hypothetical protein MSHO_39710 [Mycobacterium shottsii]
MALVVLAAKTAGPAATAAMPRCWGAAARVVWAVPATAPATVGPAVTAASVGACLAAVGPVGLAEPAACSELAVTAAPVAPLPGCGVPGAVGVLAETAQTEYRAGLVSPAATRGTVVPAGGVEG